MPVLAGGARPVWGPGLALCYWRVVIRAEAKPRHGEPKKRTLNYGGVEERKGVVFRKKSDEV